jgi:hypothetical protein
MAGLVPSQTVLDGWTLLTEAAQWAGLSRAVLQAVSLQLGDAALDSLPIAAVIPVSTWRAAVRDAAVGGRELTAIEKGQVGLLLNAVRAKFAWVAVRALLALFALGGRERAA